MRNPPADNTGGTQRSNHGRLVRVRPQCIESNPDGKLPPDNVGYPRDSVAAGGMVV